MLCDIRVTIHKYHAWILEGYWDWSRLVDPLSLMDELVFLSALEGGKLIKVESLHL